ncbi:MAG: VOC family protein [Acidimicrobiales bacterium]|nr:VOC family protein [Acidimicrobiales bacterium]
MTSTQLAGFTVACTDVDLAAETFATITGGDLTRRGETAEVAFDDVTIEIVTTQAAGVSRPGVCRVALAGSPSGSQPDTQLNSVAVHRTDDDRPHRPAGDVEFDHVALAVGDLAAATDAWADLTGCEVHQMGTHPISGGAFEAARVLLGNRMIELLSPVPGVASAMAERIAKFGDNVIAVAMPAKDLDAKLAQLEQAGIAVLDQPPHKMVHPRATGGVLLQLTPRVQH